MDSLNLEVLRFDKNIQCFKLIRGCILPSFLGTRDSVEMKPSLGFLVTGIIAPLDCKEVISCSIR